jgi:hypothetical protein
MNVINFLPKHNYYIYEKAEQGWFFVKLLLDDEELENRIWHHGLTHKRIVWNLFKLTGGSTGYYLADIKSHRFYYCGTSLQFVKAKLKELNGLIEANFLDTNRRKTIVISEKFINPIEEIGDFYLVYEMTHINRFRPYDIKSKNFINNSELKDFAISKGELYSRFLRINGGKHGFYVYKAKTDEVLYFSTKTEVSKAVIY